MQNIQQRIAVKALIVNDQNKVLLLRKSNDDARHAGKSGRYNLPGGKVNPGEHILDALVREVREETGLTLKNPPIQPFFAGEWHPTIQGVKHQIVGIFYMCNRWEGTVVTDSEHDSHIWIAHEDAQTYDVLPPEDEAIQLHYSMLRP